MVNTCYAMVRGSAIRVTALGRVGQLLDPIQFAASKSVASVTINEVAEGGGNEMIKADDNEERRLLFVQNGRTIRHKVDIDFLRCDPGILSLVAGVPLRYDTPRRLTDAIDYAWTGAPGQSPSVKRVNGVEKRRNWAEEPVPLPVVGGTEAKVWRLITSYWAAEGTSTLLTGGPEGRDFRRKTITATTHASNGRYIIGVNPDSATINPATTGIPVTPGEVIRLSFDVRYSVNVTSESLGYRFYDAAGAAISGLIGIAAQPITPGQWSTISFILTVPAGAALLGIRTNVNTTAIGATFDATRILVEKNAPAFGTYFDGNTPDVPATYSTPNVVGFDSDTKRPAAAFALEVWSKLDGQRCADGTPLWGYTLFPFLKGGYLSGFKFDGGLVSFNLRNAQSRRVNRWGVGWADLEGVHQRLTERVSRNASFKQMLTPATPPVQTDGVQTATDIIDGGDAFNTSDDIIDNGTATDPLGPWIVDGGRAV